MRSLVWNIFLAKVVFYVGRLCFEAPSLKQPRLRRMSGRKILA